VDISTLRDSISGQVLTPGDEGYPAAVTVTKGPGSPLVAIRPADAADVAAAVAFARDEGLELSVRSGGHDVLGRSTNDGGIVIDLRSLAGIEIDGDLVSIGGGALWGDVAAALAPHGLAISSGDTKTVGVGGLTLGGGVGWFVRLWGLAIDSLVSAQVVLADGRIVTASETQEPDLFWALRGGGGNFGVVTEFEFRLHDVGTRALSVELDFPVGGAAPTVARWCDLAARAPRAATYTAGVHDGVVALGLVWVGDPGEGLAHAAELESALSTVPGMPVARRVEELSYLDLQTREDNTAGHAVRRYWKGHYVTDLSLGAIEALLATEPGVRAGLQAYGGAITDVPDADAAFSQRDTRFEYVAATGWTDPAEDAARIAAARASAARLEPFASGVYVNVLGDDGAAGVQRAYPPAKLARLAAVKAVYDPDNVFHLNQNIAPAAEPAD
jgi:FAD/FMN-containing dehydrogenase